LGDRKFTWPVKAKPVPLVPGREAPPVEEKNQGELASPGSLGKLR